MRNRTLPEQRPGRFLATPNLPASPSAKRPYRRSSGWRRLGPTGFALALAAAAIGCSGSESIETYPLVNCCTEYVIGRDFPVSALGVTGRLATQYAELANTSSRAYFEAEAVRQSVLDACRGLVTDLGAVPPNFSSYASFDEDTETIDWCKSAEKAVAMLGGSAAKINLRVQRLACSFSAADQARCEALCEDKPECAPADGESAEVSFCDGEVSGHCAGTCDGSADLAITCNGTCDGMCSGTCVVDGSSGAGSGVCTGRCIGTCRGACTPPQGQAGPCEGRCVGTCSGPVAKPRCLSDVRPLSAACSSSGLCNDLCAADTHKLSSCPPPGVAIEGAANLSPEEVIALQTYLPEISRAAGPEADENYSRVVAIAGNHSDSVLMEMGTMSYRAGLCMRPILTTLVKAVRRLGLSMRAAKGVSKRFVITPQAGSSN